jgi:hypothetical protein
VRIRRPAPKTKNKTKRLMALLHIVRFDSCWQSASQNPNGFWSWGTQKSRVHLPAPRFFLSPTHTLTLKEEHFVFIYTTCWVHGNSSSSSSSCKSCTRGVERESVKLPESGGRFQSVALSILNGHIVDSVCLSVCCVCIQHNWHESWNRWHFGKLPHHDIGNDTRVGRVEIKSRTSETLWRQPMTPPTRLFERGLNSSQNVL